MNLKPIGALIVMMCLSACSDKVKLEQEPEVSESIKIEEPTVGRIEVIDSFPSKHVAPRRVEVYLPPNYAQQDDYQVLYMHDGQNVFSEETASYGNEWGIDEALDTLIPKHQVPPTIVVAIWNVVRHREYMPAKPNPTIDQLMGYEGSSNKKFYMKYGKGEKTLSDEYLQFIVKELKPYIDSIYHTNPSQEATFIGGSSMGGLISVYAIAQYPDVFRGAACVSTHWIADEGRYLKEMFYQTLPRPKNHKLYMDYGTETLDAHYEPQQKIADSLIIRKGYEYKKNWITVKYEGAAHDEPSWRKRVPDILTFLLN